MRVYCTSIQCRAQQTARALPDFAVSARAPRELAAALLAAEHRVGRALVQLLVARGDAALHGHALPRQEAVRVPLRRQALAPQPRAGLLRLTLILILILELTLSSCHPCARLPSALNMFLSILFLENPCLIHFESEMRLWNSQCLHFTLEITYEYIHSGL